VAVSARLVPGAIAGLRGRQCRQIKGGRLGGWRSQIISTLGPPADHHPTNTNL
jgi:hypothetical protein